VVYSPWKGGDTVIDNSIRAHDLALLVVESKLKNGDLGKAPNETALATDLYNAYQPIYESLLEKFDCFKKV
jgi:hypothetical protein